MNQATHNNEIPPLGLEWGDFAGARVHSESQSQFSVDGEKIEVVNRTYVIKDGRSINIGHLCHNGDTGEAYLERPDGWIRLLERFTWQEWIDKVIRPS